MIKTLLSVFQTKTEEPCGRTQDDKDATDYEAGVTTLLRLKSGEKATCRKPENIAAIMRLFFLNAGHIVRIFDSHPLEEIYNNKDLLIEANIFLRRGGRIQFLHAPTDNAFLALLKKMEAEGFIQAETREFTKAFAANFSPTERQDVGFATMDSTALRQLSGTESSFCANDPEAAQTLNQTFASTWKRLEPQ